eukprot:8543113-Pyramimonas_sp.AAC.1
MNPMSHLSAPPPPPRPASRTPSAEGRSRKLTVQAVGGHEFHGSTLKPFRFHSSALRLLCHDFFHLPA